MIAAALLSNLDKNPPVNSNIEPSINATSDLSNDGGSSKRGSISYSYSECVIKLSSKNKNGMNCELSVTFVRTVTRQTSCYIYTCSCRGILYITALFHEHIISKMTIYHCLYI